MPKQISLKTTTLSRAFLPAAAAMACLSCGALAADIPARVQAPPPAPVYAVPVFTWTGFYVGANAGWAGGGDNRTHVRVTPPGTGRWIGPGDMSAFAGGLQAGYNYQFGSLVLGIETDIQALAGGTHSFGPATLPDGTIASGRSKMNWYGTLRPRIGYAFGRTMIYATGGLAYGDRQFSIATVDPAGNTAAMRTSGVKTGWTVGGGIEHALSRNWSAKLEYLYVDLGRDRLNGAVFTPAGVATGTQVATHRRNDFHTIKAGINYRF